MTSSMSASAAAARATGVRGDATPNEAIAAMAREIQGRLTAFRNAVGNMEGPVVAANLQALAGQQAYREVGNAFVMTDHATAFLRLVGHQTTEVRVAQEGLLRAQLGASEAAAAMVNHALSAEGAAHPMFGNLLTALLTTAGTLTASLGRINDDRWRQLAGNLTPHAIASYGTPAEAIKAAIVLMSCQFQVQARLVPYNFSGAPIDARFKGVDEAVKAACASNERCLSEADVSAFARHALGIQRFGKYPTTPCPDNVLLLRIWAAAELDEVFDRLDQLPAAVERDPVFRSMKSGERAPFRLSATARAMQLVGFSEAAPAFRSASADPGFQGPVGFVAGDPLGRPPTQEQAQTWAAQQQRPEPDEAEQSDDDGYSAPSDLEVPQRINWADDTSEAGGSGTAAVATVAAARDDSNNAATAAAATAAAATTSSSGRYMWNPYTGQKVATVQPEPSWAAHVAQRKQSALATAFRT